MHRYGDIFNKHGVEDSSSNKLARNSEIGDGLSEQNKASAGVITK